MSDLRREARAISPINCSRPCALNSAGISKSAENIPELVVRFPSDLSSNASKNRKLSPARQRRVRNERDPDGRYFGAAPFAQTRGPLRRIGFFWRDRRSRL